jgi:hypothetical protein
MRLWSLHPRYLDRQGLTALWREGLLARAVIRGETRGYTRHPQLQRFQVTDMPERYIDAYLWAVHDEAVQRGYRFDGSKLGPRHRLTALSVTDGQLEYEWRHLGAKLQRRSPDVWLQWAALAAPHPHPLFQVTPGAVAPWERPAPVR